MPSSAAPRTRFLALGALCTVAVLGLAACGPSGDDASDGNKTKTTGGKAAEPFADLSGPEIARKALAANVAATSMTVRRDTVSGKEHTVSDFAMSAEGNCLGTQTDSEGTLTVSMVGPTMYQKLDEKSVRTQYKGEPAADVDNAVDVLANLWTKEGSDSPEAKDNASFCDLHEMGTSLQGAGSLAEKGPVTTVNGQQAITLTEKAAEGTLTMYVATTGTPYLLKYAEQTKEPTTIVFSDFGKPVPATVPAAKDMVDPDKLES